MLFMLILSFMYNFIVILSKMYFCFLIYKEVIDSVYSVYNPSSVAHTCSILLLPRVFAGQVILSP